MLAVCGFLLLAVALVFGQTACYEFVNYDDDVHVYENPHVAHGLAFSRIVWAFTHVCHSNWIPLTWISFMLDSQLYGLSAGGFHLTNVLLHATAAVLLFLVLWRMTGGVWPGALVAAVFAVHPLPVESVAWVTERKDVLSGLFCMLILGAYLGYVRHPSSLLRYLAVTVLFAFGLMAKGMLITLPFVLLLLDYWPLGRFAGGPCQGSTARRCRRHLDPTPPHCNGGGFPGGVNFANTVLGRLRSSRHLLIEKLPLFVLVAIFCLVTRWAQRKAAVPFDLLPLWWRIGNALVSYVAYLGQFFYPTGLAVFYPHPSFRLPMGAVVAAALVLACISAAAVACRRRCPYLLVGWLWYVGMLLPVSGLGQVGGQARADRFVYLPQIGLCLALAWGAADLCRSWAYRRRLCGAMAALVLAVLMACAWRQTCFWHDSEALWIHTLACTSPNSLAHNNLGSHLADCGRSQAAMAQYRQALEVQPNYGPAYQKMGAALADQGQLVQAIACFRTALNVQPDFAAAHCDLADTLVRSDQIELAIVHYHRALEIDPDYAKAHGKLANVLTDLGRLEEAMAHYEQALEIDSYDAEAAGKLAWLLATCPNDNLRNGARAVELAERAASVSGGKKPEILDALAAANAEAGRFPEAIATARRALSLAIQQNNRALAGALRARIARYEAGRPFHQMSPPLHEPQRK